MNREQFPILEHGVYANHAAIAPWPKATADAVAAFARENADTGPGRYKEWIARERELRGQLATLLGADGIRDIALLPNTTEGVCAVAFGYPWQEGDNVVLPEGEFPSNRLPWLAQRTRGVEVREIGVRNTDDPEAALIAAIDDCTRVLAASSVSFSDGLRLDLGRLGAACEATGALFFVDAIQQLGVLPIDVESSRIDCLSAGAHKWMLGPEGMAVFYCAASARPKLELGRVGWHMFDYPWKFERPDWTPSETARRFEAGSPNSLGQAAMHASLSLILDEGIDRVTERILENTRRLASGLSALPGVALKSAADPDRQSGIVSFSFTNGEPRAVYKRLMESGVTCALREGNIRLSPHFYQDETVIDELLRRVEDAL